MAQSDTQLLTQMAPSQELGSMADQVEAWFQTVTDVTSGSSADIIQPIDFVPPTILESGSEREIARQATATMGPRKDVIAAAIAAGKATMKQNRQTHADMSVPKAPEAPKPLPLLQRLKNRFMPKHNVYVPKKPASAPLIFYLRVSILAVMVLSGIVLTHMALVKLGQPGPLDSAIHHGKHIMHMVRGKHHNKHAKCEEWAAIGGCAKNPVFMNEMCRTACYHAPAFDEVLVDNNPHCSEWAPKGECLNNPKFMMIHCPKSCSDIEKVHESLRSELLAQADHNQAVIAHPGTPAVIPAVAAMPQIPQIPQNEDKSEYCPHWAATGECTSNPTFMHKECPRSCAFASSPVAPTI